MGPCRAYRFLCFSVSSVHLLPPPDIVRDLAPYPPRTDALPLRAISLSLCCKLRLAASPRPSHGCPMNVSRMRRRDAFLPNINTVTLRATQTPHPGVEACLKSARANRFLIGQCGTVQFSAHSVRKCDPLASARLTLTCFIEI
ncbi:hypothetical protein B0H16DRAFT_548277 [Mycena metata]|uniref:Uncharacterized protein n=1 Tax=Mycena metata TaxID=1033252 RepID=A0AAD7JF51_9AGAR|nr:hypothetical protein B0H16DRAFT_548277 [Mycena metata]